MSAKMTSFWFRACETVLLALAFLLPLAFFLRTFDGALIKTTLFEAGTAVMAFAWLFRSLERGRWELPQASRPLALPALALLAWTVLRYALAPYKLASLPGFLTQVLCLLAYVIALLEFGGAQNARRLTGWLTAAAWLAGLYGVCQRFGLDPFAWKGAFGDRVFSTFGDPSLFAFFLALCAPLTLAQWLDPERDWFLRWTDIGLLALLGLNIVWTGSPEGLAAFAIMALAAALLLPLLLPSKASLKAAGLSLALLLAVAAAAALSGTRLSAGLDLKGGLWRATAAMTLESPLTGHGPGSFSVHLPRFRPAATAAHPDSALLETAAELGLIGVGLWLWLFATLAVAAWQARRQFIKQGALSESCWLAGLSAATAGLLAAAQLGPASQSAAPVWLLWILAGMLGGLTGLSRRSSYISVLPLPLGETARRRLYAPALLAFAGLLFFPMQWLNSEIHHNTALASVARRDWNQAIAHFNRVRPGAQSYVSVQYLKAGVLLDSDRPAEALAAYDRLESLSPNHGLLHYQKAVAYAKLENWENAAASHARHATLAPTFAANYAGWAQAAKRLGDLAAAETAAKAALSLEPDEPAHQLALAEIYLKEKRVAEARRLEQQAARLKKELKKKPQG